MAELRTLFPKIEPYRTGWLKVSEIHSLYYEEVGNPAGIPVVFLHGGPGAGIHPTHRRFFNTDQFRVILFNQRGAGKSKPSGELRQNDTWELVEDIERLRQSLEIKSWFVFGGSWGSTLALAYAQSYPGAVRGLVLRGIFLGRQRELNWEYVDGASRIFPEAWEKFAGYIPTEERKKPPAAYYRVLSHLPFPIKWKLRSTGMTGRMPSADCFPGWRNVWRIMNFSLLPGSNATIW
jgi:proline iminopeptidase